MLEPAVGSLGGGRANPQGAPIVHTSSDQLGTLNGLENFVRPSGMISFRNVRGFFCSMLPISPSIAIVNPCQEKTMTKMRYPIMDTLSSLYFFRCAPTTSERKNTIATRVVHGEPRGLYSMLPKGVPSAACTRPRHRG